MGHLMTQPQWHGRKHVMKGSPVNIEDCWWCQRSKAICKSKNRYFSRQAAHEVAEQINQSENYSKPTKAYTCRWGVESEKTRHWHVSTKVTHAQLKRIERRRRKWRVKQILEEAN